MAHIKSLAALSIDAENAAASAALCDICHSLNLDDKGHGGCSKRLQDGRNVLGFDGDGRLFPVALVQDVLPGLPMLTASSLNGCAYCGLLKQAVCDAIHTDEHRNPAQAGNVVSIDIAYAWNVTGDSVLGPDLPNTQRSKIFMSLVVELDVTGGFTEAILFSVSSSDDLVAPWLRLHRPPETQALCDQNVRLINNHIQDCVCNHLPNLSSSFLPTRLIALGKGDTNTQPRLVVTADMIQTRDLRPGDIKYATLSYCWGPSQDAATQTKTERSSFARRLQGIPLSEMSLVMRDAVSVCEALNIRYLWIDSLCIIQDDVKDWESESERMGHVYLNSFITICVPASHSCHQSFLQRQNRRLNVEFQSGVNPAVKGSYIIEEVGLTSQFGGHYPSQCTPYNIDKTVSSWGSRGWVYQERELSPRKLVFGRSMFHYVCPFQTVSENGHLREVSPLELDRAPLLLTLQVMRDKFLDEEAIHMAWGEICCDYASLQLTKALDKLPALSGLAKLWAGVQQDSSQGYVAGIWKAHLLRGYGLLWLRRPVLSREALLQHFREPESHVGPTWSWVNHGGSFFPGYLHYHFDGTPSNLHSRIEFRRMSTWHDIKGTNQFGCISGGVVGMTGRLASFSTLSCSKASYSTFARRLRQEGRYIADCALDWITDDNGEELHSLVLLPLLSTCLGTAPKSLIFSEVLDGDLDNKGNYVNAYRRPYFPPSDSFGFSQALFLKISEATANTRGGGAQHYWSAQNCCTMEMENRDAFGLILHPAGPTGRYWRVGMFYSEARRGGGTALFQDTDNDEFQII